MSKRREDAQVLFIMLQMQAELMVSLLDEGALSPERARPLVWRLVFIADVWLREFEEGGPFIADAVTELQKRVGTQSK